MTLLLRPSIHLNKSLTRLKVTFHETAQEYFLSSKFGNVSSTFFHRSAIFDIISASEPTRIMKLLLRPSIHLNKSLTRLKVTFHETAQEYFLSSKFENVSSTFFHRSAIFDIISASEPTRIMKLLLRHSIHLNKSLIRLKVTFLETAQEYFLSSNFDNVLSTFFIDHLYPILSLLQSLLGL